MKKKKTLRPGRGLPNVKVHDRPRFPRPAVFRTGKEYNRQRMKRDIANIAAEF